MLWRFSPATPVGPGQPEEWYSYTGSCETVGLVCLVSYLFLLALVRYLVNFTPVGFCCPCRCILVGKVFRYDCFHRPDKLVVPGNIL